MYAALIVKAGFLFVAAAVLASAATGQAQTARLGGLALPSPYQLVGVEARTDEGFYDEESGLTPVRVVVDLGSAQGRPPPSFEDFQQWTLLGSSGWVKAQKVDIEKRCEYLCGGEDESCYYVAIIAPSDKARDIGTPLAAIAGDYDLEDYNRLNAGALDQIPLQPSEQYSGLFEKEKYRIKSLDGDAITLEFQWRNEHNEHAYDVEDKNCTAQTYGNLGLENTTCNGVSILSGSGTPLIASYADYNSSKTTPLTAFTYGGSRYFTVRYGAKAQDIIGLVGAAPAGWRGLFKGRDHALLC